MEQKEELVKLAKQLRVSQVMINAQIADFSDRIMNFERHVASGNNKLDHQIVCSVWLDSVWRHHLPRSRTEEKLVMVC